MLAEVRKRLADPHTSLDGLCELLAAAPAPKRAMEKKAKAGRHVRWQRDNDYEGVIRGREFANATELDAAWDAKKITLADVWLVRHHEAHKLGKRSQLNPQWEALYYLADQRHYVRVQKCHLRYLYDQAGRVDRTLAWTMLQHEEKKNPVFVPYWVDRHAFSVLKIK